MDSLMEREETETLRMYATRLEVEIKKLRNEEGESASDDAGEEC